MTVDLSKEVLIPLSEAARLFEPPKCYETVRLYVRRGYKGIKLEGIKSGRDLCTSRAAVFRFMHAISEAEL